MMENKNFLLTRQRRVILDEIRKVKTHPTADEVYEMVRQKMPKISLGTVYRNLEKLSEKGFIKKISVAGLQKRFDGNTEPHYHFRCQKCTSVIDVPDLPVHDIRGAIKELSDYKVLEYNIEIVGLWPECK